MATFFQAPTVEQLACILRDEGWSAPWQSLAAIQPKGAKPPFFCVHAVGGNVLSYYKMAYYLGEEQPFYGLQARGLDGEQTPRTRIEEIAADYIKEIQTLQPSGPYFIGGYSFGGLVAYEMARQLHAQGQKMSVLVLFDAYTPEWLKPAPFHVQVSRHLSKLLRLELKDKLRYVKRKLIRRFYSSKPPLPPLEEAHQNAYRHYVTQVYPGRAILFRASEQPEEWLDWLQSMKIDPQLGWGKLVAGGLELEIQEVPGKHTNIFTEPYVRFLAEKLQPCLDSAQADI